MSTNSNGYSEESVPGESMQSFITRLEQNPERGYVVIVRVTNKQAAPIEFQLEPTGDMAPPLQPGDSYDIVAQSCANEYVLDVHIETGGFRIWVEGSGEGQIFHKGVSVAY